MDWQDGEDFDDDDDLGETDFVLYQPTSHGEDIDFWFEFDIEKKEGEKPRIVFNINF